MDDDDRRLLRLHLTHLRRLTRTVETQRQRDDNIRRLQAALGVRLVDVTAEQLERWQDDLRSRVARASLRCYTSHARAFFSWAAEQGHMESNPARDLLVPRVPVGRPRPIEEAPLRVAVRLADEPVRTWLMLAAVLGLRAKEIASITREGIGGDILDVTGKGDRPRSVPLPGPIRTMLLAHVHGPGPVWRRVDGRPMTGRIVSRRCCRHLQVVGASAVLHQLRHRCGTEAYVESGDLRVVQDLLGHASPATTAIYVGASAARARRTTDALMSGLADIGTGAASRRRRRAASPIDRGRRAS